MKAILKSTKRFLSAFTLIEILIGLTIFSIISMSLYSTFFSGTSIWKRSEDVNRLHQEARWSLDTISKELRNAIVFNYGDVDSDFSFFNGATDSISFLISTDDGIKKVSYFLADNENQKKSLKREENDLIDSLQASSGEALIETFSSLVAEEGLKFSYAYSMAGAEDEIGWNNAWEGWERLPRGIRISLVLQNPRNQNIKTTFSKTVFIPTGDVGAQEE